MLNPEFWYSFKCAVKYLFWEIFSHRWVKSMGFNLESIIPWGRSMLEYIQMFDLTPDELKLKILNIRVY